jgi:hypothetical protein
MKAVGSGGGWQWTTVSTAVDGDSGWPPPPLLLAAARQLSVENGRWHLEER